MIESIILCNINNHFINFKNLLTMKDTIIWRNCNNLKIKIKSKINKIIFENCNNIVIQIHTAVCGVEFNKCNNVKIIIKENINCIESFRSSINFIIQKKILNKIIIMSEQSKMIQLN